MTIAVTGEITDLAPFLESRPTFVFTHRELPVSSGVVVRFVQGGGDLAGQFFDAGALDVLPPSP